MNEKFKIVVSKPWPKVRVVSVYNGAEAAPMFPLITVTKPDWSRAFIDAGDTIEKTELRALAMLEAVRVAREMDKETDEQRKNVLVG